MTPKAIVMKLQTINNSEILFIAFPLRTGLAKM